MPCFVILIPKNSFCNTVCACMVMQIKLVVVVVVSHRKSFLWGGGGWGGSVANIIEHGYYTIYEKSCILEIEN